MSKMRPTNGKSSNKVNATYIIHSIGESDDPSVASIRRYFFDTSVQHFSLVSPHFIELSQLKHYFLSLTLVFTNMRAHFIDTTLFASLRLQ